MIFYYVNCLPSFPERASVTEKINTRIMIYKSHLIRTTWEIRLFGYFLRAMSRLFESDEGLHGEAWIYYRLSDNFHSNLNHLSPSISQYFVFAKLYWQISPQFQPTVSFSLYLKEIWKGVTHIEPYFHHMSLLLSIGHWVYLMLKGLS